MRMTWKKCGMLALQKDVNQTYPANQTLNFDREPKWTWTWWFSIPNLLSRGSIISGLAGKKVSNWRVLEKAASWQLVITCLLQPTHVVNITLGKLLKESNLWCIDTVSLALSVPLRQFLQASGAAASFQWKMSPFTKKWSTPFRGPQPHRQRNFRKPTKTSTQAAYRHLAVGKDDANDFMNVEHAQQLVEYLSLSLHANLVHVHAKSQTFPLEFRLVCYVSPSGVKSNLEWREIPGKRTFWCDLLKQMQLLLMAVKPASFSASSSSQLLHSVRECEDKQRHANTRMNLSRLLIYFLVGSSIHTRSKKKNLCKHAVFMPHFAF